MIIPMSTSAAKPIGGCPNCGGMRYENLVHHCGSIRLGLLNGQLNAAGAQPPVIYPLPASNAATQSQ